MQYYVVYRRALPLWAQLGPDAGRPLQMHSRRRPGAFFATLPRPGGWAAGPGPAAGPAVRRARAGRASYADDPNVIDAEVVEDDDDHGPPELHAPTLIVPYTRRP